jgi:hypothetical protein
MMVITIAWWQFWRLFASLSELLCLNQKLLPRRGHSLASNLARRSRRAKTRAARAAATVAGHRVRVLIGYGNSWSILDVNNRTLNCEVNKKGIFLSNLQREVLLFLPEARVYRVPAQI